MPVDIGRISGIMLKDNLTRDGVDLAFETDLIYLDVNNSRIGIKKNNPDTPLDVLGTTRTDNFISNNLNNGDITIDNSRIITALGSLNISATTSVDALAIGTDDLLIDMNTISTTTTNTDIRLEPDGSGELLVYNDLNIFGNLHATGDITLDGNIQFGNNNNDNVDFNADVNSDILPNVDSLYKLGQSGTTRWNGLYTNLVNGSSITTSSLSVPSGVNYALRPGNIWFVATNGDNGNQGNHENGPFGTIEKALSVATDGDTVYIYPGTYYELFPLVVPVGVSVTGADIRTVVIVPDTASEFEDVFHLNGETTVSNLTIKDFYYDSINDKGYAFRFAPNITVTSRSPYIQNITVITKGSTITVDDPRGFDSGDAGKGALVDGSVANQNSKEASMLFHSVTFITPGVDALTMTSGVRIEWLNSFTYFANRSMYATQGTGRLTEDGSTIAYGAEVRSIGSAAIYGNYGAVADGANTLMYLINHNFAYIGTGKDVSNDRTLVIQANETVELNSGKIYYQSQDHTGTFRVGDTFFVDFEKGTVSFDASGLESTGATGLTVTTGSDVTTITKDFITTGNLKLAGNTIESVFGDVNLLSASNEINLTQNVNVNKNLAVAGDFSLSGQLILGNQIVDTVTFSQALDQNLEPDATEAYNLGSTSKVWKDIYSSEANINDVRIRGNVIDTTVSNSDLELAANGTGIVHIIDYVNLDQDLTVNGLTTVQSVSVNGIYNQTGQSIITGNKSNIGSMEINGQLTVGNDVYFENINIVNNRLFTTDSNSNLEISASGIGQISVPTKSVSLGQNLTVDSDITSGSIVNSNRITAEEFYTNDILIKDNYISTTNSNSNLELRGNSAGGVFLENIKFTSNIISSIDDIIIQTNTGKNLRLNTNSALVLPKGTTAARPVFQQGDMRFNTNTSIFEGFGAAFGGVYSQDRQTSVLAGSSENLLFNANSILTMDITSSRLRMNGLLVDNTLFDNNTIITTSNNLTLSPDGTGLNRAEQITFNSNELQNDNLTTPLTLAFTGNGYMVLSGSNGLVIPYGDDASRPSSPEVGDTRYNIEQGYMEVFDGTQYNSAAGVGESVTAQYMEDESYLWNLILG